MSHTNLFEDDASSLDEVAPSIFDEDEEEDDATTSTGNPRSELAMLQLEIPTQSASARTPLHASLCALRDAGFQCDVNVVVQDQRYPCHRLLLAACSDYFKTLFTVGLGDSAADECRLQGVRPQIFKYFLEFAYRGAYEVDREDLPSADPRAWALVPYGPRGEGSKNGTHRLSQ